MIDLSRNECPNPVSMRLRAGVVARISQIHKYPLDIGERARQAAAACFGVERHHLVLTRGIDDAVDALIARYRDKHFFVVTPGFEGFVERLRSHELVYRSLNLDAAGRLPDTEIKKLGADSFVLLASPNNPTGLRFRDEELSATLGRCHGALVDQTYEDFATTPVPEFAGHRHVYRFRSFSKGFGLAGLRIGALMGPKNGIGAVARRRHYCHVDAIAAQAILCVTAGDEFRYNVNAILGLRAELAEQLRRCGFEILVGETNFVLLRTEHASELVGFLKAHGILVKDAKTMGLANHVRISVGSRDDHAALLRGLVLYRRDRADAEATARQMVR